MLRFIDDMRNRLRVAREDSDATYFHELLLLGELIAKLTGCALIAALSEDPDRHRYRQMHALVRADGLGDWPTSVEEMVKGPASQVLDGAASVERQELTQRVGAGQWQFDAATKMTQVLASLGIHGEAIPARVDGLRWLRLFAQLRNATRAHGAYPPSQLAGTCDDLETSILLVVDNLTLFQRPWAHLRRNLSGKYKVTALGGDQSCYALFKSDSSRNSPDGIYVMFDDIRFVQLAHSENDAADVFLPNGAFTDSKYEALSYITGAKRDLPSAPYLLPATALPASETQGLAQLDVRGNCHTNMPPVPRGYVARPLVEKELRDVLLDDRHPIVTLSGAGGIGKTWLTLTVLDELAATARYEAILWFSARDIDLLPSGPKLVRPAVLSQRDIARDLVRLVGPSDGGRKGFDELEYLSAVLGEPVVGPTMFVFDNFETLRNPAETFLWVDTYVRSPNKVLITTRVREFKGDYPVDVEGMSDEESDALITHTAAALGIGDIVTPGFRDELIRESGGHPYAIKVFLGEVAKTGTTSSVRRIAAGKDQILDALFERTYASLSPAARRCFLTLSNWRSTVPVLALEAVLLRPENERMDVESAIESLRRYSFIEVSRSSDGYDFAALPLAAYLFGRRKLATSPLKSLIDDDTILLREFGAGQTSDIARGVGPRIDRLFHEVAARVSERPQTITEYLPILEFVASRYPPAWLLLGELWEESGETDALDRAAAAVSRYLEAAAEGDPERAKAWGRLAELHFNRGDASGELHALVERAGDPTSDMAVVSEAANRANQILYRGAIDAAEKRTIVGRLAFLMEAGIADANATDCSRLAWLYLQLGDEASAKDRVELGLWKDSQNEYCLRLAAKLRLVPGGAA